MRHRIYFSIAIQRIDIGSMRHCFLVLRLRRQFSFSPWHLARATNRNIIFVLLRQFLLQRFFSCCFAAAASLDAVSFSAAALSSLFCCFLVGCSFQGRFLQQQRRFLPQLQSFVVATSAASAVAFFASPQLPLSSSVKSFSAPGCTFWRLFCFAFARAFATKAFSSSS